MSDSTCRTVCTIPCRGTGATTCSRDTDGSSSKPCRVGPSTFRVTVTRNVDGPTRQGFEELPSVSREQVVAPVPRQGIVQTVRHVESDIDIDLAGKADGVHTLPLRLSQPMFSEAERLTLVQLVA